jgi:hypothetical protein
MKTDVSKTTMLLTGTFEAKFAGIFGHQILEAPERNNFLQSDVNCFGARFGSENLDGFIGKVGVEANGGKRNIYIILSSYIHRQDFFSFHLAALFEFD